MNVADREPLLDIRSLSAGYGGCTVLEDIRFQLKRGEVLALIGPNGAGKTTLIRTVSGILKPCAGSVYVGGADLSRLSPAERAGCMAVVPQAHDLPPGFSVYQTVLLGRTPYLNWLGKTSPGDRRRVAWALRRTSLEALADRPITELSGGEQQRVLLARALAQETPILLLDEPTSNLDLKHQATLLNLVNELAREGGLAVLMAVHDLNLAAIYADRIGLLVDGRMQAEGRPEDVLTQDILTAAYGVPVHVIEHPDYGTPLVLPDGKMAFQSRPAGVL